MLARLFRFVALVAVTLAACTLATAAGADDPTPPPPPPAKEVKVAPAPLPMAVPPLAPPAFNYYVHPGSAGMVGAQLYVAPRPTPPLVGHTYITYPPLLPHEFLYRHHRTYRTYNAGSGWTKTRACWH